MKLRDQPFCYPILEHKTVYSGRIFDLVSDTVDLGSDGTVIREYVAHPGSVAILALDKDDRVAVINQYRHPVKAILWEIPAGLLDVTGEKALTAAKRELAEEADLAANRWDLLVDFVTSPGGTNEALRVFLARDLSKTSQTFHRTEEEAEMRVEWLPLDEIVAGILAGRFRNPALVLGALAAFAARAADWAPLRATDTPWPDRPEAV
ncbi:MAG: NUDIX hydrolase [Cellulomonadaceae bacterium]|jgi:ADP-ribose pyrophosphatase|nr:NUDIX hydrolase [Cellulomonadaceae bacterium]